MTKRVKHECQPVEDPTSKYHYLLDCSVCGHLGRWSKGQTYKMIEAFSAHDRRAERGRLTKPATG